MSRGLGKVERWILEHTYLKSNKGQMPGGWKQIDEEKLKDRLYRSEIMLNYYELELSPYRGELDRHVFKMTNTSKSANASCSRSVKGLMKKGLIEGWMNRFWGGIEKTEYWWSWLTLTKEGNEVVKKLSVNS